MLYNSVSDHDFYGLATHEWIGIILPYESQKIKLMEILVLDIDLESQSCDTIL